MILRGIRIILFENFEFNKSLSFCCIVQFLIVNYNIFTYVSEIAKSMSEENQPEKLISFSKVIGCSAKHDRKSVEQLKQDLRGILDIFESENQESLPEIYEKIKDQMYEKNLKLL